MAYRVFLAYFVFTSWLVAGQSPIYVLKGQSNQLKPNINRRADEILWKHNGDKVIEFDGMEEKVFGTYENRITLDWVSAELTIADLRFEDSGDYELEASINNNLFRSEHKVVVIDKVAKPTISCQMNNGSSSNTSGTLQCTAEPAQPQSLMKFEWSSNGKVQPGPELTITLGEKYDDEVYTCSVSNPLTKETATFAAKDCYPADKSLVPVIAGVVTTAIILALISGILYCYLRRKGRTGDVEQRKQTQGSDKETAQGDETRPLVGGGSGHVEGDNNMRPNDPAGNHKEDANAHDEMPEEGNFEKKRQFFESYKDGQNQPEKRSRKNKDKHEKPSLPSSPRSEPPQLREAAEKEDDSDSEKANESDPAPVSADLSVDKKSDLESSTAAEQPGYVLKTRQRFEPNKDGQSQPEKRSRKNKDKHENPSPPSSPRSEPPQLREAAEKEDDSDSEKANESDPAPVSADLSVDKKSDLESSTAAEQPVLEKNKDEHEKAASPPSSPRSESTSHLDPNDLATNNKGDAEADPAPVSADQGEDKKSDLESSTAAEQPGYVLKTRQRFEPNKDGQSQPEKRSRKNKDKHEKPSPPSSPHSEPPQLREAAEKEDDSDSEKANESDPAPVSADQSEDKKSDLESSTAAEQPGLEKNKDEHEKAASPPSSPRSESTSHLDPNDLATNNKGDAEADPAPVSADQGEDKKSDLESSTAAEQPGYVLKTRQRFEPNKDGQSQPENGSRKNKDKHEKPSPPSSPRSEPPQFGEAAEKEDDSDSEKANESDPAPVSADLSVDKKSDLESSTAAEQTGYVLKTRQRFEPNKDGQSQPEKELEDEEEKSTPANDVSPTAQPHEPLTQDSPNVAPKDNIAEHKEGTESEKTNESDDSSKDEEKGSQTSQDNHQEMGKPVSAVENKSDSVGEIDEGVDLYLATSQQPQSPTPTKPDNNDQGKTSHDSDESGENKGEPVVTNGVQQGSKEEKQTSLSEDK